MPRVAMYAYWFPPCTRWGTAAARAAAFARHLPEHGWDPIVVTPEPGTRPCICDHCATAGGEPPPGVEWVSLRPLPGLRAVRALRRRRTALSGPATESRGLLDVVVEVKNNWVRSAGSRQIRADAVWTTSGPYASLAIGHHHARRGTPWVADLRDPIRPDIRAGAMADRVVAAQRQRDRRRLRAAAAVVAVNEPIATRDSAWLGRTVTAIPSGVDQAAWAQVIQRGPPEQFTIACAGALYDGFIEPDVLLAGLAGLPSDRRVVLDYYGRHGSALLASARRHGVADIVVDHGFVPATDLLHALADADLIALFTNSESAAGITGGKFHDYVASGRPIIAAGPLDAHVEDELRRFGAGRSATSAVEVTEIVTSHLLAKASGSRKAGATDTQELAWPRRAAQLAALLGEATGLR